MRLTEINFNHFEMDWAFNTIRMHVKSSALLLRDLIANHFSEPFEILNQDELQAFLKSILPSLSLLAGEKKQILNWVVSLPHPLVFIACYCTVF